MDRRRRASPPAVLPTGQGVWYARCDDTRYDVFSSALWSFVVDPPSLLAQRIHSGLGLTGLFAVVACGGNSPAPAPIVLHDTTGAEYQYVCDQQPCSIVPTAKSPPLTCCGKSASWSYSWDQFFTIVRRLRSCIASASRRLHHERELPTAPDGTASCASIGSARSPDRPATSSRPPMRSTLCQAGDPWPGDCGMAFLDDPAYGAAANKVLAAVCPSAQPFFAPSSDAESPGAMCPVPPSCLQP